MFLAVLLVWVVLGCGWLFPRKMKLLQRRGNLTNDQLIQLAKEGDVEAASLLKDIKIFIAGGLLLMYLVLFMRYWVS